MITKEEFAAHLRSLGYDAENDRGSVMVTVDDPEKVSLVFKRYRKIAKQCGYDASGGVRVKRETE